ncbi:MAG: nucleoside deaminase [Bacilli bacterium]|nr:nucleoside deaminase [Bacilli bacterium]
MKHAVGIATSFQEKMTTIDFMKEAIKEAKKAERIGDVPVGCVVVIDDEIIARAHNLRHNRKNSLDHAEMIAIGRACRKLNRWILDDATLYITLEPCLMCSGAILQARVRKIVYGCPEPKFGCSESIMHVFQDYPFNHHVEVEKGVCAEEIESMMKNFFKKLRQKSKKLV